MGEVIIIPGGVRNSGRKKEEVIPDIEQLIPDIGVGEEVRREVGDISEIFTWDREYLA